jgi:hypothetical protein
VSAVIRNKQPGRVLHNLYYTDFDENKERTVDIYCPIDTSVLDDSPNPDAYGGVFYVAECKKSEKNAWVFFEVPTAIQLDFAGQIVDFIALNDYDCSNIL